VLDRRSCQARIFTIGMNTRRRLPRSNLAEYHGTF